MVQARKNTSHQVVHIVLTSNKFSSLIWFVIFCVGLVRKVRRIWLQSQEHWSSRLSRRLSYLSACFLRSYSRSLLHTAQLLNARDSSPGHQSPTATTYAMPHVLSRTTSTNKARNEYHQKNVYEFILFGRRKILVEMQQKKICQQITSVAGPLEK